MFSLITKDAYECKREYDCNSEETTGYNRRRFARDSASANSRDYAEASRSDQRRNARYSELASNRDFSGARRSHQWSATGNSRFYHNEIPRASNGRDSAGTSQYIKYETPRSWDTAAAGKYSETTRSDQNQIVHCQTSMDAQGFAETRSPDQLQSTNNIQTILTNIFGKMAKKSEQKNDPEYENFMEYYRRVKDGHFDCPVCNNRLANRQNLFNHFETMHADRKLPSYYKPHHSFHRRLISKFKKKCCAVCKSNYSSFKELRAHISKRHEIDVYNCTNESCSHITLYRANLEKHEIECDSHKADVRGVFEIYLFFVQCMCFT